MTVKTLPNQGSLLYGEVHDIENGLLEGIGFYYGEGAPSEKTYVPLYEPNGTFCFDMSFATGFTTLNLDSIVFNAFALYDGYEDTGDYLALELDNQMFPNRLLTWCKGCGKFHFNEVCPTEAQI